MLAQRLIFVLGCAVLVAGDFPTSFRRVEDIRQADTVFQNEPAVTYRLPNNTRPISYDVQLTTNIHTQTDFRFTGEVSVRFVAVEESRSITLHQRQLIIGEFSLVSASNPNERIPLNSLSYDNVTEFLTFTLSSGDLFVGSEYILSIRYQGTHRTDDGGFYRTSYLAKDGSQRYLL